MKIRSREEKILLPLIVVRGFHLTKGLQNANCRIHRLCQGKLLAHALSGTANERKVGPLGSRTLPSFRRKFMCIFSIEVLTSMEAVNIQVDFRAFRDEDWSMAIPASTSRKNCISGGESGTDRDWRVETEDCAILSLARTKSLLNG